MHFKSASFSTDKSRTSRLPIFYCVSIIKTSSQNISITLSQISLKVIPLFCTAHTLLRITSHHSRWRWFVPPARKDTNKGLFCRAAAFIRNNDAADRLTASWFAIEKQENERNLGDPEVCSGFSLRGRRVVELLKCPG